jgi:hypothetical protein
MTKARSNATANAAKGDLTVGNGTNLSGVLGVGNNGETIVADSSTSTGLRYTAGTVQSNPVLNSAMQVWQRGTSFTTGYGSNGAFAADRWQIFSGASTGRTFSRQATGDTTNLPNIQYCLRAQRNSGDTQAGGANYITTYQNVETLNSVPFAGKTLTFSFYARAGANFSAASNVLTAAFRTGTGTDQNGYYSGYTGQVDASSINATLTTTWQRFSGSISIPSNATEMAMAFQYSPVGTAGAADYFEVTGVQLDIGSVALPFRTYSGTIQGELAACQRYYYRSTGYSGSRYCTGFNETTTNFIAYLRSAVTMRVTPTAVDYSNLQTYDGAFRTVTNVALVGSVQDVFCVNCTVSGVTANQSGVLSGSNASSFIGFSAEL